MSSPSQRLADAVKDRRDELGISQLEVWRDGGPSNTLLTQIENGRLEKLTWSTARKIDKGLRWPEGTTRRLWEGSEGASAGDLVATVNEADLSEETKAHMLRLIAEDQERRAKSRKRGAS